MRHDWFAPKLFGYGAGLPIAWQGWAVLLIYLVVVIGTATWLLPHNPVAVVSIFVGATAVLISICKRRTQGGWRWRSGGDAS